ncbi:hypothetical protein CMV_020237 [Castanea mollissima]|uniref:Uncharacterized protein n=1 Tax=Castanea mollissima TaxID=60419 RepID=A0A8J4VAK8_9ROSI|nr:hypothetical protein CMV_020237 [Castanea mollissima]
MQVKWSNHVKLSYLHSSLLSLTISQFSKCLLMLKVRTISRSSLPASFFGGTNIGCRDNMWLFILCKELSSEF